MQRANRDVRLRTGALFVLALASLAGFLALIEGCTLEGSRTAEAAQVALLAASAASLALAVFHPLHVRHPLVGSLVGVTAALLCGGVLYVVIEATDFALCPG